MGLKSLPKLEPELNPESNPDPKLSPKLELENESPKDEDEKSVSVLSHPLLIVSGTEAIGSSWETFSGKVA